MPALGKDCVRCGVEAACSKQCSWTERRADKVEQGTVVFVRSVTNKQLVCEGFGESDRTGRKPKVFPANRYLAWGRVPASKLDERCLWGR